MDTTATEELGQLRAYIETIAAELADTRRRLAELERLIATADHNAEAYAERLAEHERFVENERGE